MNLPQKKEDFMMELPGDWESCVEYIENSVGTAMKMSLKMFWFTGRIVDYLQTENGTGTVPRIARETGYSERSLYYMQNMYRSFQAYDDIETMANHKISWTGLKELARLEEGARSEAFDMIKAGDLTDDSIEEYVEGLLSPQLPSGDGELNVGEPEGNDDNEENEDKSPGSNPRDPLEKLLTWFQGLHTSLVKTRTEFEVPLTDISDKIDSLDVEDGTDPGYVMCSAEIQETIQDIDRFKSYLDQVKRLLER